MDGYRLDPLEYRHPIVAPFRGFTRSGLLTTPIWKYIRLKPLEGSATALAFDNRDPAIVEGRVGRGRSILVATAASPDSLDRTVTPPTPWTALSSWPSFPPLVHEMLRVTLATEVAERNVMVGDELAGTISASLGDEPVVLSGSGGMGEKMSMTPDGSTGNWSFGATSRSGIYTVRRGSEEQKYAVNLNPRESDLNRFDPELLPSQLHRDTQSLLDQTAVPASAGLATQFRWLLVAVIVLLVIEPLLIWQFARGLA
jgi:hypothetical protein